MNGNRSHNFEVTVRGKLVLPEEEVRDFIKNANSEKQSPEAKKMVQAVTGGAPVDETNFDKVFAAALRRGYRNASRDGSMEGFDGLTKMSAEAKLTPRGGGRDE